MKVEKALGGPRHDRLAEYALKKLEEKGVINVVFEVNVSTNLSKTARIDILGFLDGKKIGVECYVQVQPKLITKRIPLLNVDELIFCVPNEREAEKLHSFNKEVWIAGFSTGRMWIEVSEEIEDAVRDLAQKKGDISKLFEVAMRVLLLIPNLFAPPGKFDEKRADALLDFVEDNIDEATRGLDLIVAKMIEEGKLPLSSEPEKEAEG